MEDYPHQGPPAYKRSRLSGADSLQASANFPDARANMVPFGFISPQDVEPDLNMAGLPMGGNLAPNLVQDVNQTPVQEWKHEVAAPVRNMFVRRISQALISQREYGENADSRLRKWIVVANKIEDRLFKTATSELQYLTFVRDELRRILCTSSPAMSSQFLSSSSTTSAVAANNIPLVNMQQNYGSNDFVTATQSQSQLDIAPSKSSVFKDILMFPDLSSVGGAMRVPVTSSIGSARPSQSDAFHGIRQPGPRPMVHDQVPGSSVPIGFPGDPSQFMPNAEQVIAPNLLHSMNVLMGTPLSQFVPSSAVGSQQRFGLNDSGVLSENSSIMNSQMPSRMPSKEWHKYVSFNNRNRLIRKVAQIFSTTPDPQPGSSLSNRMHNCISIANCVEKEAFRTANSVTHYLNLMARRCHFIARERANSSQQGIQYYNLSDIRRTYEALGITYPMSPSPFPNGGGNGGPTSNGGNHGGNNGGGNNSGNNGGGNYGGGNMRLHGGEAAPPPPPPGVLLSLPMPYCVYARNQTGAAIQQASHNQLLGTDSDNLPDESRIYPGAVPLSMDGAEAPEVIKQLAHAYKCQERDNQENEVMLICSLPYCRRTKNFLNHITTCQFGASCCGSTKEIIEHWNRCTLSDCPICLPVRQAERNLNSTVATTTSMNNQMNVNPVFMRRQHQRMGSNYPSTATSGLLSNQSQNSPNGSSNNNGGRNERISPRSSMWHSNYNDTPNNWRSRHGNDMSMDNGGGGGGGSGGSGSRRSQSRGFWLHYRNGGNRHERQAPYNNPWAPPEIIFVDNGRNGGQPPRASSLFDRLQPYGAPWRAPEILYLENVRPAHRQPQGTHRYSDEPVIIPPDEDATPTEGQQMMAIVKVVKTHGGRLEQKFRCSRRSCTTSWPCLHRRLAASIQSHKTPIPG